eukprot:SAG31_NODE_1702_length_7496_cov_2.367311_4_plen_120_part_00
MLDTAMHCWSLIAAFSRVRPLHRWMRLMQLAPPRSKTSHAACPPAPFQNILCSSDRRESVEGEARHASERRVALKQRLGRQAGAQRAETGGCTAATGSVGEPVSSLQQLAGVDAEPTQH